MLVLSRRENQTITIGNDIVITVVSIKGGSVRLGISAPASVSIHRDDQRPLTAPQVMDSQTGMVPFVDSQVIVKYHPR